MKRDELIANLAIALGDAEDPRNPIDVSKQVLLPVVVEFVAAWLDDLRNTSFSQDEANIAVSQWRKDMT